MFQDKENPNPSLKSTENEWKRSWQHLYQMHMVVHLGLFYMDVLTDIYSWIILNYYISRLVLSAAFLSERCCTAKILYNQICMLNSHRRKSCNALIAIALTALYLDPIYTIIFLRTKDAKVQQELDELTMRRIFL